jgi:hypothetical protein
VPVRDDGDVNARVDQNTRGRAEPEVDRADHLAPARGIDARRTPRPAKDLASSRPFAATC